MTESHDEASDEAAHAGALRPKVRPLIIAATLNLALAGVLLGIPYARGPSRAEAVVGRWAAFAACFFDAEAIDEPGLGLPRGERARYASMVIRADAPWPGRCRDALNAIAPEESPFLFPGVKNAEARLRAAAALLDGELVAAQRRRDAGDVVVSDRPMRAMSELRGALAELGVAASVRALRADRDAVRFDDATTVPAASIVPTRVDDTGRLEVAVDGGAVLAGAADERTVAHVRVAEGRIEQRLARRPGLVSGLLGAREPPYAIFSTDRAQCAEAPDRCAQRATGLAPFVEDRQLLEAVVWLQAHPVGDPAAAVRVDGSTAWIAAAGERGIEARRFALPELRVRALGEEREVPQVVPEAAWPVEGISPDARVLWIATDPPALAFVDGDAAGVLRTGEGGAVARIAPPAGVRWLATCPGWAAIGSERGVVAHHVETGATHEVDARVLPPVAGALRVACRDDGADVWTLADGAVSRARCTADGCAAEEVVVPRGVAAYDVASIADAALVAWTDDAEEGAIRVTRVTPDGATETTVPAACWTDPVDGLCGVPSIAADGETAAVVARDETDLRIVTTTDGLSWRALTGLEQP